MSSPNVRQDENYGGVKQFYDSVISSGKEGTGYNTASLLDRVNLEKVDILSSIQGRDDRLPELIKYGMLLKLEIFVKGGKDIEKMKERFDEDFARSSNAVLNFKGEIFNLIANDILKYDLEEFGGILTMSDWPGK